MPPPRDAVLPPANKLFVDREEPQAIFWKAARSIPEDGAILRVFYGIGGQGKTALCRELMRKSDPLKYPATPILRRALLDLHGRPKTDPDLLLVWIRNGFASAGLDMPCFDLALALAWEGTRGEQPFPNLVNPWLGRATKAAQGGADSGADKASEWLGGDTAKELVGEAIGSIPGVGFVLRRLGNWAIDKGKRAYLERTRDHLQHLYRDGDLLPAHELSRLLPWMLAQDLNFHIKQNWTDRLVLFVDEYERVFDQGGAGARWVENRFDRHMRDLVAEAKGLLTVFFSRERLPWASDADWKADLEGNQLLLGGLAEKDAQEYLSAIPITDAAIRTAIIAGARESSDANAAIYPLLLDLQVEHWRVLEATGKADPARFVVEADTFDGRCKEIVERLLRDYGPGLQATLERLSVARRFDRAAFEHVVKAFGTGLPLDHYDRLAELSFLTQSQDGYLSLHNAIAKVVRDQLPENTRQTSAVSLLEHFEARAHVDSHFDLTDDSVTALFEAAYLRRTQGAVGYVEWLDEATVSLDQSARFEPNKTLWREALAFSECMLGSEHPSTGTSLNNLAGLLREQGDYTAAKPLFERALAIAEKACGPEHPSTGTRLNNLASLLEAQGDYASAKPLFERALAIAEKAEGPEHPSTGTRLNNLANLLRAQGDYASAKPLFERALAIAEKALGPEHPSTGSRLNNLANLLEEQGDFDAAKPLFGRALVIAENALGPEHPWTAASLNNLAGLHYAQGDYGAAKALYERALAIREKTLGPDHPATGTSLNDLAGLLKAQGDYASARPLFERSLAITENALGPEHPWTAANLNNLAALLKAQGDYGAAKPLNERALAIAEKALGPEHPSTGASLNNLAGLLWTQGDYASAKPLYERALAIAEKAEGPEHPSTGTRLNNLANLLEAQGDHGAAKPLFERALAIAEKALGPEHPSTGASLNNLAGLHYAQGDYGAAKALYERALAIAEKAEGPEHPSTGASLNNLGRLLEAQGDYAAAKPLYEKALAIAEKTLGLEHPSTGTRLHNLASLLEAQGDYAAAKPHYERALTIFAKALGPDHPKTRVVRQNLKRLPR